MAYVFMTLAFGLTFLSMWRRFIVFNLGAAIAWLAFGIALITDPHILGDYSPDDLWFNVVVYVPFLISAGVLLWYIAGIGKTSITMTNLKGQTWKMWAKPPKGASIPRDALVKERHKERLKNAREHRRTR